MLLFVEKKNQENQQEWLSTLDMLPISDAIFAKKYNVANSGIDWILYDVYKIASDFPLEISTFGHIFDNEVNMAMKYRSQRLRIANKFLSKSTRDDLKGLKLTCARVVCIHNFHISFFFSRINWDKRKTEESKRIERQRHKNGFITRITTGAHIMDLNMLFYV